jgi:hypothetical protein
VAMKQHHDSYAKSWTSKFSDGWYLSLRLHERGMWDQLYCWAKFAGDMPQISFKSWAHLGAVTACDARTARKILTKFQKDGKVVLQENQEPGNFLSIFIVNYEKHQSVRNAQSEQGGRKSLEKCAYNRTEQNRTEDTLSSKDESVKNLVSLFHQFCPSLPKIAKITTARLRHISARLAEYPDSVWWENYFQKIEASDFLAGRTRPRAGSGQAFRASFDWIMNPANLLKILEGNYDNRNGNRSDFAGTDYGETSGRISV